MKPINQMQAALEQFRKAMGQVVGDYTDPKLQDINLAKRLIAEEHLELMNALGCWDLVQVIDGMCDLLYVIFSAAVGFGINLQPFFDEVHRTNMLKTTGEVRPDGKRLKPPDWKPPRIAEMLAELTNSTDNK